MDVTSTLTYNADLAVVCKIDSTYTNLMLIFNMRLNGTAGISENKLNKSFELMELLRYNSASKIMWDTFKVNSVTAIPGSKFLVASVDGYGAIFYHTGTNEILFKLNLTEYDTKLYLD